MREHEMVKFGRQLLYAALLCIVIAVAMTVVLIWGSGSVVGR